MSCRVPRISLISLVFWKRLPIIALSDAAAGALDANEIRLVPSAKMSSENASQIATEKTIQIAREIMRFANRKFSR